MKFFDAFPCWESDACLSGMKRSTIGKNEKWAINAVAIKAS